MSDVPPTEGEGERGQSPSGPPPSQPVPPYPGAQQPSPGAAPPPYQGGQQPYPGAAPPPYQGGQQPYPGAAPPPYQGGQLPPYPPPGGLGYGATATAPAAQYASYGARLGGWLIDWLILAIVNAIITRILVSIAVLRVNYTVHTITNGISTAHLRHISLLAEVINIVIILLYGALLCGSARGQTLGMMIVRAKAVDGDTGTPIGFGRALGRAAFELLLFILLFIPWVVDMLFPAWDSRRQTLHDKVSRTVVLRVPQGYAA
jgi:uncharacterized RDD family membrane protein YckC